MLATLSLGLPPTHPFPKDHHWGDVITTRDLW